MSGNLGDPLFTFAVISDSHVNEADDASASPYPSNRLANGRFRYLVRALNQQKPAFTVHLGDMANPLPELATYDPAARNFQTIADELESPLHLVAGNHCVGDKPTGWVPVPRICEESLAQFERTFGRDYYAFDHGPCHFVVLSSLLVNSGTPREDRQRKWLKEDLDRAAADGQRLWVMMHYPLYVAAPEEPGSYDNVDEPGRSWLLDLFERHGVEAAFSGHVHNFFYNRDAGIHMYTVPATSFVRQDYGELYGVEPQDKEGGRNDTAKLGYFLVRVHERGHTVHHVRTQGRSLERGERLDATRRIVPIHPREGRLAPVGVEVRENWLSRLAFMTNNSVSPFTRRWARNDWPLVALTEMGVSRLRLFLRELENDDVVERMADLRAMGYEILVYSYGRPKRAEYDLVREHHASLAGWELIMGLDQIDALADGMERLALHLPNDHVMPWYLSEVRDVRRGQIDDANVRHVANYGFQVAERERIERLLRSPTLRGTFDGFVFRLRRRGEPRTDLWPSILQIGDLASDNGRRHQVHVLFSGNITAEPFVDDLRTANRVAEAVFAAVVAGNVDLWLDTFEDSDRGYFLRHGLVDRRYNPRLAARVLGHLNAALAPHDLRDVRTGLKEDRLDARLLTVGLAGRFLTLVLPDGPCVLEEVGVPAASRARSLMLLDLGSGALREAEVSPGDGRLRFAEPVSLKSPLWIEGELA